MADQLLIGKVYPLTLTFTDDTGTLVDPDTIDFVLTKPDGATVTKAKADFTRPSVGKFTLAYLVDQAGRFWWEETSTNPDDATQGWFDGYSAGSRQPYVIPQDVRDTLAGTESLTGTAAGLTDDDLTQAIEEAQTEIDGRLVGRYDTPFTDPPTLVVALTRDIAAYLATLTQRRGEPIAANEPIQLRYNRAQTLLAQAASGALPLAVPGADPGQTEGETEAGVVANRYDGDLFGPADFGLATVPSFSSLPFPWSGW